MIKKTITYNDYNGEERTEDFYFNLTKAEWADMQLSVQGGLKAMIDKISQTKDIPKVMEIFKDIIRRSYGEKSSDGRRFIKSKELFEEFSQTEAYSELYMELITNSDAAAAFINGIVPSDMSNKPVLEVVD